MNIKNLKIKVEGLISELQQSLSKEIITQGDGIYKNGDCCVLSISNEAFIFQVDDSEIQLNIKTNFDVNSESNEDDVTFFIYPNTVEWNHESYACLNQMLDLLNIENQNIDHKKYTRQGMINRVLEERRQKALHAEYRIKWAKNIYGDHILTNENGVKYKIFLRDFENETGYSNSKDSAVNKLGTTKHIMFAFNAIKQNKSLYKRLTKKCPFVEIYCNPLNDYKISYFYPHDLDTETEGLLNRYFNTKKTVENYELPKLTEFFFEARNYENIVIRPEVFEKVNNHLESQSLLALQQNYTPDFSSINATLYDYQQEGISFASCRKHAIIADEMGLGKTVQAIGAAMLKKELFGFSKTLVVCPASLKEQWKKEIEKFTNEKAEVVSGHPNERAKQYVESKAYFLIINYETVLRDQLALNKARIDFLILDEAQKVKNYATKTASAIKNVSRKHVLIITGTPIENKLIDLFSIMTILDPHLLGPLWEFSYQHCLFDVYKTNKINAYYNLSSLKEELKTVLIRREKRIVIEQLPNIQQQDIPVKMSPLQADFHASYASGIGQITNKKFLTAYDLRRLQQLLTGMRMVCNSTYLVDENTNDSPKLEELKYVLLEKLNLKNENRKVIIFSEWVKSHKLIGQMLLENNIGYTELNGKVNVKKRGELIRQFEENDNCKVFLSTEAGGAGLNLQVADILINFELPWNPAKKNQRIGRIDRLGQKSKKLSIFNFITTNSIEQRIALGLLVKQNLFDSVLNEGDTNDFVDFTEKGRGQFLQQMKELADDFEENILEEENTESKDIKEELEEYSLDDFKKEYPEEYKIPFEEDFEEDTFSEETEKEPTPIGETENEAEPITEKEEPTTTSEQMEEVLNNGMQFLSGLMKMATGKDVGIEDQEIKVDKESGEVTMKFKMPKF